MSHEMSFDSHSPIFGQDTHKKARPATGRRVLQRAVSPVTTKSTPLPQRPIAVTRTNLHHETAAAVIVPDGAHTREGTLRLVGSGQSLKAQAGNHLAGFIHADGTAVQFIGSGGGIFLPRALAQRDFGEILTVAVALLKGEPQQEHAVAQRKETCNSTITPASAPQRTSLPARLQTGIESLSGISMEGVAVHYNSPQPAQLGALAYAQGSEIHLAPGQEQHLPHEAWHLVQQAQGRVPPMQQMKGGFSINADQGLEHEADVMGAQAAHSAIIPANLHVQSAPGLIARDHSQPHPGDIPADKGLGSTASLAKQLNPSLRRPAEQVAQLKLYYRPPADKENKNTALSRLEDHPLTVELSNSERAVEVEYVTPGDRCSAGEGFVDEANRSGFRLRLPGADSPDSTPSPEDNEVTTIHELVHAQAWLANEFDGRPQVFHSIYKGKELEGREMIPLEEALTVGFKNEGDYTHKLNTVDTFRDLSELTVSEWSVFPQGLKARYERIYGKDEARTTDTHTENRARSERKKDLRKYYAYEAQGKDEAWEAPRKPVVVSKTKGEKETDEDDVQTDIPPQGFMYSTRENDGKVAELTLRFTKLDTMEWKKVHSLFQQPAPEEFSLFATDSPATPSETEWVEAKAGFQSLLSAVEALRAKVKEKGELSAWAEYRLKFQELLLHPFYKYQDTLPK